MARLFLTIIFLVGVGVVGLFFLRPSWTDFNTVRTETQHLRDTIAELDQLIANRDGLLRTINAISQDDLARINQTFPQSPDARGLVVLFENLAGKNGIALSHIDISGTGITPPAGQPKPSGTAAGRGSAGSIQELPVNFSVSGPYAGIKAFLTDTEKSTRVITIKEITFSAPTAETAPINVNIKAATYYQQ